MNEFAQCKDHLESFLREHQVVGETYSEDEWASIEKTVPANAPSWYRSLLTTARISRLSYRLQDKTLGVRRCIIYSGVTSASLFGSLIDPSDKFGSGWAFEWFPIGSAEDGNYWVLNPNETFVDHKLYLMAYEMIDPNAPITVGNGIFSTSKTLAEFLSETIPTRMDEELW